VLLILDDGSIVFGGQPGERSLPAVPVWAERVAPSLASAMHPEKKNHEAGCSWPQENA